jgi:hypothetical protein
LQSFASARVGTIVAAWLALCAIQLLFSTRELDAPGLYYDEATRAGVTRDFLEGATRGSHMPGVEPVSIAGRPVPWKITPYLGSLAPHLLIPAFAVFGSETSVLRVSTLSWALLGALFAMLWANATLGGATALLAGLLLVFDPSFLFGSRHDWGSFAPAFLCRCAGLFLVASGWRSGRTFPLVAGGLVLGLGIYNKVDFAAFLLAAGVGLLAFGFSWIGEALGPRRWAVVGGAAALLLASSPMLFSPVEIADYADHLKNRADLDYKIQVAWSTFDGSYPYRQMEVGGRYRKLFEVADAPVTLLGPLTLASLPVLLWLLVRRIGPEPTRRALAFVAVTGLLLLALLLAMPGVARIYHMLNLYPLPHLLVAGVAVCLFSLAPTARWLRYGMRGAVTCALAALLLSNAIACRRTFQLIHETGGRGWWSNALHDFAEEVAQNPDLVIVSLDWGFNEPLLFLTDAPRVIEPIWRNDLDFEGTPRHVYLFHEDEYDRFDFGPDLPRAVQELEPGVATLRAHRDREGEVAFLSLRFSRDHRLIIDEDGNARVEVEAPPVSGSIAPTAEGRFTL